MSDPASDPLTKRLDEWTESDAAQLIHHVESERLDFKSSALDWTSPDGRRDLSRHVAGLATAAGGYLVLDADHGERLSTYSGRPHPEEDRDNLRRALLDTVTPRPQIVGPRQFKDAQGNTITVIQVLPNPGGYPASAGGRFFTRSGPSTLPLSIGELAIRFRAAVVATDDAADRAEDAAHNWAKGLDQPVVGISIQPAHPTDLGHSGRRMLDRVRAAIGAESAAATRHLGGRGLLVPPGSLHRSRSDGVILDALPRVRWLMTHHGVQGMGVSNSAAASVPQPRPSLTSIADLVSRAVGLTLRSSRELGVAGPIAMSMRAFGFREMDMPMGDQIEIRQLMMAGRCTVTVSGHGWSDGAWAYDQVHLFLERLADNAGDPIDLVEQTDHRTYLRALLG